MFGTSDHSCEFFAFDASIPDHTSLFELFLCSIVPDTDGKWVATSSIETVSWFSHPCHLGFHVLFLPSITLSAKLMEEKCDFQRSMTNNEAKLRENEQDLKAAQQGFVEDLEKINISYSRNRYISWDCPGGRLTD